MRGDVLDAARWEVLTPEEFGDEALAWDGPGYEQTLAWRNARGAVEIGTAPLKQLVAQANRAPALVEEIRALREALRMCRDSLIDAGREHAPAVARARALLPTTEGGGEG